MTKKSTAGSSSLSVLTLPELLEKVELEGIECYELRARDITRTDLDFAENYSVQAQIDVAPDAIRTRFMLSFDAAGAEYYVDLAVRYRADVPLEVPQTLGIEFAERIGVMAAWPYLREQVFGLASRMGNPIPVLGLVRLGMFRLTGDEPPRDSVSIPIVDSSGL